MLNSCWSGFVFIYLLFERTFCVFLAVLITFKYIICCCAVKVFKCNFFTCWNSLYFISSCVCFIFVKSYIESWSSIYFVRWERFWNCNAVICYLVICDFNVVTSRQTCSCYIILFTTLRTCVIFLTVICWNFVNKHAIFICFKYIIASCCRNVKVKCIRCIRHSKWLYACFFVSYKNRFIIFTCFLCEYCKIECICVSCAFEFLGNCYLFCLLCVCDCNSVFSYFCVNFICLCLSLFTICYTVSWFTVVNYFALCICFEEINIIWIRYIVRFFDWSIIKVFHCNRSFCLTCRNCKWNNITYTLSSCVIAEQCKVESFTFIFWFVKFLVNDYLVFCLWLFNPYTNLCRFCNHYCTAENFFVLVSVCETVPCNIFFACVFNEWRNCSFESNNHFIICINYYIFKSNSEVDSICRIFCPCHFVILSYPVLWIFIKNSRFVSWIMNIIVVAIKSFIYTLSCSCSVYLYFKLRIWSKVYTECWISWITWNKTYVVNIWKSVNKYKVLEAKRWIILNMKFISYVFALHTLNIIVCRGSAIACICCRVCMRVAGMSLICVCDSLPWFCCKSHDIIVCRIEDSFVIFSFACYNAFVCDFNIVILECRFAVICNNAFSFLCGSSYKFDYNAIIWRKISWKTCESKFISLYLNSRIVCCTSAFISFSNFCWHSVITVAVERNH